MLTYRVDGDGPPLVLLDGGLMTISSWDPYVAALAGEFRIVRCDFRGQLLTPGPPYATSIEEHGRDVVALLDELGITSAHIAGVSFGGEAAMALASSERERVSRLTIITATGHFDDRMRDDARLGRRLAEAAAKGDRDAAEKMFRHIFDDTWSDEWLAQQPPDFIESRLRRAMTLPPVFFEGAAALFGVLDAIDFRPVLGRITAPTLVIGGAHDRVFPPQHSRAIADAIPHAELEIFPRGSHGLVVEESGAVVERLRVSGR